MSQTSLTPPAPAETEELRELVDESWKEGLKPSQEASAVRILSDIHKRQARIHRARKIASQFFLKQFRDYGRDLAQLKACYETTQAFLAVATVQFNKKESSIHAMIDVAENWDLLVSGFDNLNSRQVIGTISEARRFLSKLKNHPIEPETPREERERAQQAFAATKAAGADKHSPSTRKYIERAAPALRELASNDKLTDDERTDIGKAVGIITRVVGNLHRREMAEMAEPGTVGGDTSPTTDEWVEELETPDPEPTAGAAPAETTITVKASSNAVEPSTTTFPELFPYKGKTVDEATETLEAMEKRCEEEWGMKGAKWAKSLGLKESAYNVHKHNLKRYIKRLSEKQEESAVTNS